MAVTPDANGGQLLTIQKLSEKCRLSISTIHRLKRQGKIPCFQPAGKGGRLLFPPDVVERAVDSVSSTTQTSSQTADETARCLSGPRPAWMQPK